MLLDLEEVMKSFEDTLKEKVAETEAIIQSFLPEETGLQSTVLEAMNYSVLAGGKRLRPLFVKEVYEMLGGTEEKVHPFMAAIEMIHSYSLVHDDLPALDDDDYRRGRLTTHREYGEDMAILAGDGLLNYAYEICSHAIVKETELESMKRAAKAFQILASKAGIYGMVGGQTVDVEREGEVLSKEILDFINELKTGALIEAAMMMGAVLAGATEEEVIQIEKGASAIGKAFQIQDDVLDVVSTTEVLGKPVGSDEKNGKNTYVRLVGLEEAKKLVADLSEEGIACFTTVCHNRGKELPEFFNQLLLALINREK